MRICTSLGAVLAVTIAVAATAVAQEAAQDPRARAFEALLADPANVDLMLAYARLSVAARDYEAAVATLERLVDLQPDAQEARYELALAYFALGANEVARYHLDIYRSRGDLTPQEAAAADAYVAGVDERQNPLSFSGFAEGGTVYRADDDAWGASFDLGLEVDYRLPSANLASWETVLRLRAFTFPEFSDDNQAQFLIRTGPVLSLDGTAFGARLKPFVEFQIVEDEDDDDAGTSLSFGVDYSNLLSSGITLDAAFETGRISRDGFGNDSRFGSARAGATFSPADNLSVGITARYLTEDFDTPGDDRERYGLRLGVRQSFDGTWLGMEDWSVSGFLRYEIEDFDSGREDDLRATGVSIRSYFRPNAYVNTSLRVFDRASSIAVFDDEDTVFTLEAGVEF